MTPWESLLNDWDTTKTTVVVAWTAFSALTGWWLKWGKARAETSKLRAEVAKIPAEREKLAQETRKLQEEERKLREETRSITFEIAGNAIELVTRIQERRRLWEEEAIACGQLAGQLRDCMQRSGTVDEVSSLREQFCACLLDRVLPRLRDFVEYKATIESPQAISQFFCDFVTHELRRYADWLSIINNQSLIQTLGAAPARILPHSLHSFDDICAKLPADCKDNAQSAFHSARQALINAVPLLPQQPAVPKALPGPMT